MRRGLFLAPLAVSLAALAACNDGQRGENVTNITVANEPQEQLLALDEDMRNLALMRAVRDSGANCRRVDASQHQGSYEDLPMWVARCEDGRDWAVFIAPTGDVQVRACTQTEQLGLPACTLPPAQA